MIEVPIFIAIVGVILLILFCGLLYNINKSLNEIKKSGLKENNNIKVNNLSEKEFKKDKLEIINSIKSPMVGIVYLAPDPTKKAYVNIGDHIKQGDVVLLIEAMKTFNEVRSTQSGIVKNILVTNGQPVEFGEDLVVLE